nr:oligosaccharide flippase family protein [uncultured Desulfobacter sp.]
MNNPKHLRNFISVWAVSILTMILPIAIILSLGRFYDVEEFGNYAVAASFVGTIAIFLTFGLGNVVSFEIASLSDNNKSKISELMFSSFVALAIFSGLGFSIACSALYLLHYNSQTISLVILLGFGYWFIGANSVLGGVFMGIKDMHVPAISAFFILLSAVLSVFPCLYLHCPLWEIAAAWSLSQGIGCLVTLLFLYKKGFLVKTKLTKRQIWLMTKRSLGIGFDSIISRVGANLTIILLPLYLTSYQIGIFNGAFKPFMLLAFPGECCMRFFSPYIAGIRYESKKKIQEYLSVMHKLVAFFSLTILIAPIFFSSSLIKFVFGNKLLESVPYMAVLAFGFMIYYSPPQSPPLMALGLEWKVVWCSIVRLLSNLIALVIFVPKYGIMGAVIAVNVSLFSYWIITVFIYYKAELKPIKNFFKYIVFASTTFLLGWAVSKWFFDNLLGIAVFFIISSLVSLIIYWDKSERQMVITHAMSIINKFRY